MAIDHRATLREIKTFHQLVSYLRDQMNWPIEKDSFEDVDDLFYDYTAEELGIDAKNAAKIRKIKRLRPLTANQPWGIFFVEFEPKRLPVVALRRILSQAVRKKRATTRGAEQIAWSMGDLLFISNYGEGDERQITFAHFSQSEEKSDLPTLKVLGWDNLDTAGHLDLVASELTEHLAWPDDDSDTEAWRTQWRSAFTLAHREVISTAKQLSVHLAGLARNIRDRIITALKIETERGPLTRLMNAFRKALVHDLDASGFADMYAQTITYGLLSARITDPQKKTADDFTAHLRTNPFLRELMEEFLHIGGRKKKAGGAGIDFDELGVADVVELLDEANMEAVVRDFGDRNQQEDPVIHFYEHFLSAYNKQLKIQRGVFYTPQPVVSYIVRSVHELLQTEFGLADGLADTTTWGEMLKKHPDLKLPPLTDEPGEERTISPDEPFVQILDPATGTATFLVEVIDVIHRTLGAKWQQQRLTDAQQRAAWNDYVPQHLLPRLHAFELMMAPYAIAHMKIGLKLVETGYRFGTDERARIYLTNALEQPNDKQLSLIGFDALAHEAAAVNEIKRHKRFTVVIGNPPYSNYGQLNKNPWILALLNEYKRGLGERKLNLDDDFIKFLRFSQVCIDRSGTGLLGFITNHTYLDGVTHRRLRKSLMESFRSSRLINLHGSIKKAERCPDGTPDQNVFDIQQGVAIGVFTKSPDGPAQVFHCDLWGMREVKYRWLDKHSIRDTTWQEVIPTEDRFYFVPHNLASDSDYNDFVSIRDAFVEAATGFETARDHFAIGFTAQDLKTRLQDLVGSDPDAVIRSRWGLDDKRDWHLSTARARLRQLKDAFADIRSCCYRPFDNRTTHYNDFIVTWPRVKVLGCIDTKNPALVAARMVKGEEPNHFFVVNQPTEKIFISGKTSNNAFIFPLYQCEGGQGFLSTKSGSQGSERKLNLREAFRTRFMSKLGPADKNYDIEAVAADIFHYAYAVFHSPGYRSRYAEFLKIDFPRLPLTENVELFRAMARLGGELTALHLLESPRLAQRITEFIGGPNSAVEKISWSRDTVWVDKAQTTGFRGVREPVWNFHIGGYQVCEKWLKDRKGRTLSKDDLAHYQKIVVALSETIRLMREIDEVIEAHGGWPGAFQTEARPPAEKGSAPPFRIVADPPEEERYVTCVPLVPLKVAAGAFSESQHIVDDEWEWAEVKATHRLRPGMFVAQVEGRSMEPRIRDGAWCLFASPVTGTRHGKTVLAKLHRDADPESGSNYTLKRYESEKVQSEEGWEHARITLKPENPEFEPLVFDQSPEDSFAVIAELVEVLADATPEPEDDPTPEPEPDPAPRASRATSNPLQQQLISPPRRVAVAPTHGIFSTPPPRPSPTDDDSDARPVRIVDEFEVEDVLLHIRGIINSSDPIPRDEAIREITHALGGERVGSNVRDLIDSALTTASRRLIVETVGGALIPATRTIEDYHRDFLKTTLNAVIGHTWTDEDEAIRAATRHLGFNRTGPNIREAFKSAINGLIRQKELERNGRMLRRVSTS